MSIEFNQVPEPIVVEPKNTKAEACVIWLHGLGADGHDFEGVLPQLNLPPEASVRFIFPTAPVQPVTVNMGQPMTAWYDIRDLNLFSDIDWQGIAQSAEKVHALIQQQISSGIASEKIVLAGFSQGGVIALYAALTAQTKLAGVMALSTYFPNPIDAPKGLKVESTHNLPVFYAHGEVDPICPLAIAETSKQTLLALGLEVDWQVYPMAHQVCYDELRHISQFLQKVLFN